MNFRKSAIAGLAALTAACSSVQHLNTPYVPNSLGSRNNNQISYELPMANLAGEWFALEEAKVQKPGEWKYTGTKVLSSLLNEDRKNNSIDLESKTNSIFVPILWDKDGDNKPETEVIFDSTGPYAMKAEVNLPKLEGLAGVAAIRSGNVRYFSPTPILGTKDQVYTIIKRNEKGEQTGILMAPAEGSRLLTDLSTGQQILRGTIYEFIERNIATYQKERTDYLQALKTAKAAEETAAELLKARENGLIIPSVTVPKKEESPKPENPPQDPPKK